MSAKIISFINLKGGVAKTTTTVGTAFALAEHYHKKVLVIDLDPQTNATSMLIGEERWKELDDQGYTIATLFSDILDDHDRFDLKKTIQHDVGNVKDAPGIDLIPSSVELVYMQDELYDVRYEDGLQKDPYMMLDWKIGPVRALYDFILIDCPPNLGILTLNGLQISHGYVIPSIPDILSTYGIPQIVNRIEKFTENRRLKLALYGLVFTKVKASSVLHKDREQILREQRDYPIFQTVFPENMRYAEAAEYTEPMTFRHKWGGGTSKGIQPFYSFCEELGAKVGVPLEA